MIRPSSLLDVNLVSRTESLLAILLLSPIIATAQESDPFAGNYLLSNSAEIVLTHTRMPHFIGGVRQEVPDHLSRIFDVTGFGVSNLPNEILTGDLTTEANAVGAQRGHDLAVADFDGDDFDEVAVAWEGANQDLTVRISRVSSTTLDWSADPMALNLAGTLSGSTCGSLTKHRLVASNLDEDSAQELVLAYWGADGMIRIRTYDVGSNLSLSESATINDASLSETGLDCGSARFDITTGDFTGDGLDELLLVGVEQAENIEGWRFFIRVYEYDPGAPALRFKSAATVGYDDPFTPNTYDLERLAVVAGDLTGDLIDEAVIAYTIGAPDSPTRSQAYAFRVAQDLSAVNVVDIDEGNRTTGWIQLNSGRGESPRSVSAITKDINQDGRHELFVASRSEVRILDADDDLVLRSLTTVPLGTGRNSDFIRPFDVGDLNAETALSSAAAEETETGIGAEDNNLWRFELVSVAEQEVQRDSDPDFNQLNLNVYELRSVPGQVRSALLAQLPEGGRVDRITGRSDVARRVAVALGDFDRDSVRLGRPRRSSRTDIVRPLVVLNAPPIHYDLLNDQNCPGGVCDVARCFGGGSCDFIATHERISQRTIDVTTQVNADWTVSKELEVGLDFDIAGLGFKIGERLKGTVGEQFSKTNRYTRTLSIEDRQTAIVDDFIYALVADYTIWEYPIYAMGEIQGWLMAVVPGITQRRWFDSKSFSAAAHVPAHEVGNILSYQSLNDPADNNTFAQGVRFQTGDGRTLGGFASSSWGLTDESSQETTTERAVTNSVEGTPNGLGLSEEVLGMETPFLSEDIPILERVPSASFAGTSESVEGTYDTSELSISKSTVRDERGLFVDFGPIDLTLGNVRYTVTPYVYWAKNGALVLDYAVEPETASIGAPDTFWDVHYGSSRNNPGRPDPAFILPWRYDPEKGFPLSEPAQREQTKDIAFVPVDAEPGEVVTIVARVHNWSLIPTDGPVTVRFYNGDPKDGGTLLVSPSGDSEVPTTDRSGFPSAIAARGVAFARMDWTLPNDDTTFFRIYAEVDPGNVVSEVHEDNNVGWSVLIPVGDPLPLSPLAASVLPTSRSAKVGSPVTAFATMINSGPDTATGCKATPLTVVPGTFSYQTTDPNTNALTGTPDTPVDIPGNNGIQTFVVAITPTTAFAPADIQIGFDCADTERAIPISGVSTLLLSSSATPAPDIVALGVTPSNDSVLRIPGTSGIAAFAVATVNVASAGSITASADTGGTILPLTLSVCQTDPDSGGCVNPTTPGATATAVINNNETPTFAFFATATGAIPVDFAKNRILVRFRDDNNVVRGSTSVAVTTQ